MGGSVAGGAMTGRATVSDNQSMADSGAPSASTGPASNSNPTAARHPRRSVFIATAGDRDGLADAICLGAEISDISVNRQSRGGQDRQNQNSLDDPHCSAPLACYVVAVPATVPVDYIWPFAEDHAIQVAKLDFGGPAWVKWRLKKPVVLVGMMGAGNGEPKDHPLRIREKCSKIK